MIPFLLPQPHIEGVHVAAVLPHSVGLAGGGYADLLADFYLVAEVDRAVAGSEGLVLGGFGAWGLFAL